jgi:RimJ/RimL family protein N-acetyltransferase
VGRNASRRGHLAGRLVREPRPDSAAGGGCRLEREATGGRRKLSKADVLETDRLILRRLSADDAEFVLELVNDPAWLRFIGDRGVRTLDDAREYIRKGPVDSYSRLGFGLYAVEQKEGGSPIGICGLVKRDFLDDVDIGFALLPAFRGKGYAREAARATMSYAREVVGLERIVAITSADNDASARLLEEIGLRFERMIRISPDSPENVRLYGTVDRGSGNLRALD